MKTIALFAIPGCVSFPGTQVPLHVFEPRYREMVNYCLENKVMMGVCHTQKIVHQAKEKQTLKDALSSNQSTYKPEPVFSIGDVELIETLPDGRLKISVHMRERSKLEREVQTLPFSLVEVTSLPDITDGDIEHISLLKEKIIKRLFVLFAKNPAFIEYFESELIQTMHPSEFSNTLFSIVRLDPDIQQSILEMRSAEQRLEKMLEIINSSTY